MKKLFKIFLVTIVTMFAALFLWILYVQMFLSKDGKERVSKFKEDFFNFIEIIKNL